MTGQHSGHCEVREQRYWRDAPVVMYGNNKEYAVVGNIHTIPVMDYT